VVVLVVGSAAAGRAPRVVLFVFVVVNALRVVVVDCVDDLQSIESFKTRPGSMSESSPLESYANFRDFREVPGPGELGRCSLFVAFRGKVPEKGEFCRVLIAVGGRSQVAGGPDGRFRKVF